MGSNSFSLVRVPTSMYRNSQDVAQTLRDDDELSISVVGWLDLVEGFNLILAGTPRGRGQERRVRAEGGHSRNNRGVPSSRGQICRVLGGAKSLRDRCTANL